MITYEECYSLYGDRISEETFANYAPSAIALVNVITHNRAMCATGYKAERVKMAICAVILETAAQDAGKSADGARLTSVSNDGYTESYGTVTANAAAAANAETEAARTAAMRYLSGTGLVSML